MDEKLTKIKQDFKKKLPEKLVDIESRWQLLSQSFDSERLADFHLKVHSLCGSSGTFGYMELSQASRNLESYLKKLLASDEIDAKQKNEISELFNQLKMVLNQTFHS